MSIFSLLIQSLPNKINVQSCKNVNKKKKTYKKDKFFVCTMYYQGGNELGICNVVIVDNK